MTTRKSHKQRGANFESNIRDYFRSMGYEAERLSRTGKNDEGDVTVWDSTNGLRYVFECKAPGEAGRINLSGWSQEARVERKNYAKARALGEDDVAPAAVLIKARGKSIQDSYLVFRLGDFFHDKS